jgi:lysophospholipase L1-like esterase
MELHNRHVDRARQGHIDLLFVGDSITYGWDEEIWKRHYDPRNAAHFGIPGDKTQQILWRIQNGELDGIRPKVVVLMVGTNNLTVNTVDEIDLGVAAIVHEVRHRLPDTRTLLLGIFPRGPQPDAIREKLRAVNVRIARLDDGSHVRFLDIGRAFVNDDGTISPQIMPDYIHLTRQGYRLWAEAMEPTLRPMLEDSR